MPALLARVAVISGIRAMAAIRRGPALRERRAAPRGNTAHEPARSGSALVKEFRRLKADENDRLQRIGISSARWWSADSRCCISTPTDKPHHCHRRLVAEYLKQGWGDVDISHLG